MLDEADLELNLLQFVAKSFQFERTGTLQGTEFAVFSRTETETESKFRPKLVRLRVVVPRGWLIQDVALDAIVIGRDGTTPGPRSNATAVESAAETTEFREQGVDWRRVPLAAGGFAYVPREWADRIPGPGGPEDLGLP